MSRGLEGFYRPWLNLALRDKKHRQTMLLRKGRLVVRFVSVLKPGRYV